MSAATSLAARIGARHKRVGAVLDVFQSVMWGPGPPADVPAATQAEGMRRYQYPPAANQQYTPRLAEGRTPFDWLISMAATYDTAAVCIQARREEMSALDWAIVPRSEHHKPSKDQLREAADRVECLDGRLRWDEWISLYTNEVLVTDAPTVMMDKTRKGEITSARLIDGTTIKPLVDNLGNLPAPPNPAFQQVIYGTPFGECCDAAQPILQGKKLSPSEDYIIYAPKNRQQRSAYGMSPTEMIMLTVNRAIRRQTFDIHFYADSNIPDAILPASPEMTREQVEEMQTWLDSYANDPINRRKLLLIPSSGSGRFSPWQFKPPTLDSKVEEFLDKRTTAAYGVTNEDLGWTMDSNRSTSAGQENVAERRRLPYIRMAAAVVSMILWGMGYTDVKFEFLVQLPQEDEELKWTILDGKLKDGVYSLNQVLEELGLEKVKGADNHYIYLPTGPIAVPIGLNPNQNPNPTPGGNADEPPPDPMAGMGGGGAAPDDGSGGGYPEGAQPIDPETGELMDTSGEGGSTGDVSDEGGSQANAGAADSQENDTGAEGEDGEVERVMPDSAAVFGPLSDALAASSIGVVAAGLCVLAADTGRVLMIQRSMSDADPAAGSWEFPGGHIEAGESPEDAAKREWAEETGCILPPGEVAGHWRGTNGVYVGVVYLVGSEGFITINSSAGMRSTLNPDDPDCDGIEVACWWDPAHLRDMAGMRAELSADWDVALRVIMGAMPEAVARAKGNEGTLLKYWKANMGGGAGQEGDFEACVSTLSQHASIDDPEALCAWLHKKSTGATPGHAAAEVARTSKLSAALAELNQWERWAVKRVGTTPEVPFGFAHITLSPAMAESLGRGAALGTVEDVARVKADVATVLRQQSDRTERAIIGSTVREYRDLMTNSFAIGLVDLWLRLKAGEMSQAQFGFEYDDLWEEHSADVRAKFASEYEMSELELAQAAAPVIARLAQAAATSAGATASRLSRGEKLSSRDLAARGDQTAGRLWALHFGIEEYAIRLREYPFTETGEMRDLRTKRVTWETVGDDRVCIDCSDLSQQQWYLGDPEMPLPGEGTTQCMGACRCALQFS